MKTPFAILILLAPSICLQGAVETYIVDRGRKSADFTAIDSRGELHRATEYGTKQIPWLADRTKSVPAEYPFLERMRHHAGSATLHLFIDLNTGSVTSVTIKKSTGFKRLDDSAVACLRKWRWKPGTWKEVDMPVVFTIAQPPTRVPAGVEHVPKAQ